MQHRRIIPRLDIKGPNLVKGIHLEGLRVLGKPEDFASAYFQQGADELIFQDVVASLYQRNQLDGVVSRMSEEVFIPITVGGGIRSLEDIERILRAGADKVAINSAAVKNPDLVGEIAAKFGSQCMVLSVEAKKISHNSWEVYIDNGRERTYKDVIEWVKHAVDLGAGEILLTSIDQEGTRSGFDISLVKAVTSSVSVPIIASGGMGTPSDVSKVVLEGQADAVAMADILHYERATVNNIRHIAKSDGIQVRNV